VTRSGHYTDVDLTERPAALNPHPQVTVDDSQRSILDLEIEIHSRRFRSIQSSMGRWTFETAVEPVASSIKADGEEARQSIT
jgi:hypothetical protein